MELELGLLRRASAEAVGTALLVVAITGSGIAAQRQSPGDAGLRLLETSVTTGAALVALILALGPISGARLNPVVTLADRILGRASSREAGSYVLAQVLGAGVGAMVANVMFDLPVVSWSTQARSSGSLWFGELVATFGLVLVILGVARTRRAGVAAFAVGGYVTAAYWFTSSTSFANPAVTVGRALTDTFAGIAPASVPMFVLMQLLGGLAAVGLARFFEPRRPTPTLVVARDHDEPVPTRTVEEAT